MTLRRQLRDNVRWLVAIALLMAGALASIGYILSQQHLSFPWEDRYRVQVEFAHANGLNPGLGQPVNVAGVRVGTVLGAELDDGRAVAELEIDPGKLPEVYRDARAVLIPTTALKDMQIDLVPGTRGAGRMPDGGRIPVARTTSPIDADELLAALDEDSRSFLQVLLGESGRATKGRGGDLRALLKALGPTAQQWRRVTAMLADRRREVERLVTNLAKVSRVVGHRDRELAGLVGSAGEAVGELADQQDAIGASLRRLPGTLQTVRGALGRTAPFAETATSALTALQPSVDRLDGALRAAAPLADRSAPVLRTQVRPFVRDVQPLARELRTIVPRLTTVTPALTSAFRTLTYLVNEAAFNPEGDDEGFLHWTAWAAHNMNSVLSTADGNGPVVRSLLLFDCGTAPIDPALEAAVQLLAGPLPPCQDG